MLFGVCDAYINDGGWRGWEKGEGKEWSGVEWYSLGECVGGSVEGLGRDCGMSCTQSVFISGWKVGCVRED